MSERELLNIEELRARLEADSGLPAVIGAPISRPYSGAAPYVTFAQGFPHQELESMRTIIGPMSDDDCIHMTVQAVIGYAQELSAERLWVRRGLIRSADDVFTARVGFD